jgi:ribonuclease HI
MAKREYLVYTDGSCKAGEHGLRPGGYGFVVRPPHGEPIEGYGSVDDTEAKTMEARAVAAALAVLPQGAVARVHSDNQGLMTTLETKLADYARSGFRNVDPAVVEELRAIAAAITEKGLRLTFVWVRSHNGNAGNERADALAAEGAREAKARARGERPPR